MKAKFLVLVAAFAFCVMSDAKADEIWTYTSPSFSSGDYITAAVDMSCTGTCAPGTYSYGSGINSITLSAYSSANTLIESLSLPGGTPFGYTDYLDIATPGTFTNGTVTTGTISDFLFIIYASESVYASEILIDGYATVAGSIFAGQIYVGGQGYVNGDDGFPTDLGGPIAFQGDGAPPPSFVTPPPPPPLNNTPLPAALPLFATGLGALGLLGWRRKRKNTAAIAA